MRRTTATRYRQLLVSSLSCPDCVNLDATLQRNLLEVVEILEEVIGDAFQTLAVFCESDPDPDEGHVEFVIHSESGHKRLTIQLRTEGTYSATRTSREGRPKVTGWRSREKFLSDLGYYAVWLTLKT